MDSNNSVDGKGKDNSKPGDLQRVHEPQRDQGSYFREQPASRIRSICFTARGRAVVRLPLRDSDGNGNGGRRDGSENDKGHAIYDKLFSSAHILAEDDDNCYSPDNEDPPNPVSPTDSLG